MKCFFSCDSVARGLSSTSGDTTGRSLKEKDSLERTIIAFKKMLVTRWFTASHSHRSWTLAVALPSSSSERKLIDMVKIMLEEYGLCLR